MKTATLQQLPQQWPEIVRWVAAGKDVQDKQRDKVIAKVVKGAGVGMRRELFPVTLTCCSF